MVKLGYFAAGMVATPVLVYGVFYAPYIADKFLWWVKI